MQIIPVTNDAAQTFRTVLNGQVVRLHLHWSDAASAWYISVEGYMRSVAMRSGFPVFWSILTEFVGDITAVPILTPEQPIGRTGWNDTHRLVYLTPEEAAVFKPQPREL